MDGDSLLSLQLHRVHLSSYSIFSSYVVDGVDTAGIEQNPLSQSGLATVDMSRDAYIPAREGLKNLMERKS